MADTRSEIKAILSEMANELQDLRANQVLLAAHVGTGIDSRDARDAKTATSTVDQTFYDGLRKRIEAL